MASYRYPRYMRSYRRGNTPLGKAVAVVGVAAALAAGAGHTVTARAGTHHHGAPARSATAAQAIAYAQGRLGLPYCWGGTGPSCYDCSGLVMQAYASAGVSIARTSQEQWATETHIPASATPRPGWLVFFAGSDGTSSAPGHVALVTGPDTMIQAYTTGMPVMRSTFGQPGSLEGVGTGDVIGYTNPAVTP